MTYKEKLIYLTAFFDGEGHVSIHKRNDNYTRLSLRIANTDKNVLDWVEKNFGGKLYPKKVYKKHYKPQWEWMLNGKKASGLAGLLYIFSIVKKEQLKKMMQYYDNRI